jgi:hypothetical protein
LFAGILFRCGDSVTGEVGIHVEVGSSYEEKGGKDKAEDEIDNEDDLISTFIAYFFNSIFDLDLNFLGCLNLLGK